MKRGLFAAAAAAAVALVAAGSAHPHVSAPSKAPPLLGIVDDRAPFDSLVRLDPRRMRPARPKKLLDLGFANYTWAFSPDRTRIAFGRRGYSDEIDTRHAEAFLRIVDPQTMTIARDIPLGRGILEGSPAWLTENRIAALKAACCGDGSELVVVDSSDSRVLDRRLLPFGDGLEAERRADRFVVLAASRAGIAPVELLAVDGDGAIRSVTLDRIFGGSASTGAADDPEVDEVQPALAVTPDGSRAFVLSAGGLVADVDLTSLDVSYHQVALGSSSRGAHAKNEQSSLRSARVLPTGAIAFTGSDTRLAVDRETGQTVPRRTTAGMWLIDPDTWAVRLVDRYADSLTLAGGLVLASGWRFHDAQGYATGTGLTAYSWHGKPLFRLFDGSWVDVCQLYGTRAYVSAEGNGTFTVVDLRRHRIVGSRSPKTLPVLVTPGPA